MRILILQALNEHYSKLLKDPESGVAPLGFSRVNITFVLVLSEQGELVDMYQVDINDIVPEHKKRSGRNPLPYFLCDKILYSLGISDNIDEGEKRFKAYQDINLKILKKAHGSEAKAVYEFIMNWKPDNWRDNQILLKYKDMYSKQANLNTIYKLDGKANYVHENEELTALWINEQEKDEEQEVVTQCLVTGERDKIARIHNVAIRGAGGQSSGTALVSFKLDCFCSYGKTQSYNAPVSKKAAFAYGTALNYLLANRDSRVKLADTTMVFWADKSGGKKEESILSWFIEPFDPEKETKTETKTENERRIDHATILQAKTILERIKMGLPAGDSSFNQDSRCFLLGLAPNAARLSVRFWQVSSFGEVLNKIARHYFDMVIDGLMDPVPPWRILKAAAIQEDTKNITPLLGGQLLKAILSGQMYPRTLYNAVLIRCRSGGEHNGVTPLRAAIVKAFLLRIYRTRNDKEKEVMVTMSLNENNSNIAYLLGRLFSVLEKVQKDALGANINATIRDRYFGAASATPGSVFPLLLRLSRHHIAKSEYGSIADRKIQDILNRIETFPAHFNLDEQGQFILGYYHQNQANYQKSEKDNEERKYENNE